MAEVVDESPHKVIVRKNHLGFGFNVRGQVNEGGTLRPIKGHLYAPMQYVSAVLENGPAKEGGLRLYDRILEINGESAEGLKHNVVVDMIRRSSNELVLTVISVSAEEAAHLDSSVAQASTLEPSERDMTEKRALPLSIPDTKELADDVSGEPYTAYNIFLSGRHVVSRRYSEFDQVMSKLRDRFPDFAFPRLPMKWPWKLNAQATDQRRRNLEEWLDQVCSYRAIGEDEVMMDFLKQGAAHKPPSKAAGPVAKKTVELRAILPDTRAVSIDVEQSSSCAFVFEAVCARAKLSTDAMPYFALFEVMEEGKFYRKIRRSEFPHRIYVTNHPAQTSSAVFLRRWLFTPAKELSLKQDEVAINFFFHQAKEDITKKRVSIEDSSQRQALQKLVEAGEKEQYLKAVRKLDRYCGVSFPHCACDARKTGHIVVTILKKGLIVEACDEEGVMQGQETVFDWSMVKTAQEDIEEESFVFKYERNGKEKWMRIYSQYYEYLLECVEKAQAEQQWTDETEKEARPPKKKAAAASSKPAAASSKPAAASSMPAPANNKPEPASNKPAVAEKAAEPAPSSTTSTENSAEAATDAKPRRKKKPVTNGEAASESSEAPATASEPALPIENKPKPKKKPKVKAPEPVKVAVEENPDDDGL